MNCKKEEEIEILACASKISIIYVSGVKRSNFVNNSELLMIVFYAII